MFDEGTVGIVKQVKLPAQRAGLLSGTAPKHIRQPAYVPTSSDNSGPLASAILTRRSIHAKAVPPRVKRGAPWRRRVGAHLTIRALSLWVCLLGWMAPGVTSAAESAAPRSDAGGTNVNAIVTRAYQDVLRRQPDPGGLQFYAGKLTSGEWSEAQLLQALCTSPEAQARWHRVCRLWMLAASGIGIMALLVVIARWRRHWLKLLGNWLWLPVALIAMSTVLLLVGRLGVWATAGPWPLLRFALIAAIITVGPGLFWLRVLGVSSTSNADRFLLVVITSIGTTALLCWLAYSVGIYYRNVLVVILSAFAAAGVYGSLAVNWAAVARSPARFWRQQDALARLMTVFLCAYFLEQLIACAGRPFTQWDAVVSWDKWGCDMAERHGLGTYIMGGYPQFLPTLYSVFYKISGASTGTCPDEQLLLHGWGLIFLVVLIVGIYRLCGLVGARWETAVAVMLGFAETRLWVPAGYMDVPQAALVVAALALTLGMLRGKWEASRQLYNILPLGVVFFALGFVKGSGISWLLTMPLLICAWGYRANARARLLPALAGVLVAVICVGPYYAHQAYYSKHSDKAESDPRLHSFTVEMGHPGLINTGRTVQQTLIDFGRGFLVTSGEGRRIPAVFVSVLGLLLLAGLARRDVWPLALATIVAVLVWWNTAAYDWRNVLPAVAVSGVMVGAGVGFLCNFWPRLWRWLIVGGTTALFGLPWLIETAAGSEFLLPGKAAYALDAWRCEPDRRGRYLDEGWVGLKRFLEAAPPGYGARHIYCSDALYRHIGERGIYCMKAFAYTKLSAGDMFVEHFAKPPPGFDTIGFPKVQCCKALSVYRPEWRTMAWSVVAEDAFAIDLQLNDLRLAPGDWLTLRVRLEDGGMATAAWLGSWDGLAQPSDLLSFGACEPDILVGSVWWSSSTGRWQPESHQLRIRKANPATRVVGAEIWLVKGTQVTVDSGCLP
jgi:hypothetical protein